MKALIFTREDAPEMREAKEVGARLESLGYEVEYLDADNESTTSRQSLYDVYSYPSFLVIRDDGTEVNSWRGKNPLESDLKNALNQ